MCIFREVRGNPIDDHPDTMSMAMIDKVHEIFWSSVSAGCSKVANRLIAPRASERMLRDRHQFYVREVHLLAVLHQLVSNFTVVHPTVHAMLALAP